MVEESSDCAVLIHFSFLFVSFFPFFFKFHFFFPVLNFSSFLQKYCIAVISIISKV